VTLIQDLIWECQLNVAEMEKWMVLQVSRAVSVGKVA